MKWWEEHKTRFPHIYIITCQIIPTPDSHGYQEPTFSAAMWMDGKLNTRQTDVTFQMKVQLYKNQEFIRGSKFWASEDHKRMAREKSLKPINESIAERKKDSEENKKKVAEKALADEETSSNNEDMGLETATVSVVPEEEESQDLYDDDMELLMMSAIENYSSI
jgi:type IV secretory pathway VirB10-like protein